MVRVTDTTDGEITVVKTVTLPKKLQEMQPPQVLRNYEVLAKE